MKDQDRRQGDVYLARIKELPGGAKSIKNHVLARGEVTGHDHLVIDGEVFMDETGKLYVVAVDGKTKLRHQDQGGNVAEHLPIDIEDGIYELHLERNFSPEEERRVLD